MIPATVRPRADDLGRGPSPAEVVSALTGTPGLACLWGSWADAGDGYGVLILSGPLEVATDVAALDRQPHVASSDAGVIGGGWVGWLGYDAAHQLGFYDHLLRWDEDTDRWTFEALWSRRRARVLRARRRHLRDLLASLTAPTPGPSPLTRRPSAAGTEFSGPDRAHHLAAVEGAIELIRAGELYQVNVCTRLRATLGGRPGDAATLFARAAAGLRPRFGAFVDAGDRAVLSLSPELFLRRSGDAVTSSPIKGTWARPAGADDTGAERLRHSAKDVAENVMIVDLVRNDLGRVSRAGSVRVRQLLGVQPHPGVWHLVSTVAGRLREHVGDAELVSATFPPGSVTGAPKVRAQRAIADLEDGPRGVYTGAIGLAAPTAGLTLSVAIRTFEITAAADPVAGSTIELGVGGGITADSVPELEWRECTQKALPLVAALGGTVAATFGGSDAVTRPALAWQRAGGLLETLLAVDGTVLRLADHLARLDRSARELYDHVDLDLAGLATRIEAAVAATAGRYAVRVGLHADGAVTVAAAPARARPSTTSVTTVTRAGLWRHKWGDRSWIAAGESAESMPLYLDPAGNVLETSRGNVFIVEPDGTLITPPLRDDLLPGITRRAVLDLARDLGWTTRLGFFPVPALHDAAAAFWTSSLSGVVPITTVDGRARPVEPMAAATLTRIAQALGAGPLHVLASAGIVN